MYEDRFGKATAPRVQSCIDVRRLPSISFTTTLNQFTEFNLLSFLRKEGAGFKTTQLDFRREIVQVYLKRYMNSVKWPNFPVPFI